MVQFDTRLRMTPYGAAVKMLRMHRKHEVVSASSAFDRSGNGLGALATMDDMGLTIQLWNLQPDGKTAVQVEVVVTNIPRAFRTVPLVVRRYVIDSSHSNCFTDANATGGLEKVEEKKINSDADLRLSTRLEPMALCLWQIERATSR